jgi:hypothetical protein
VPLSLANHGSLNRPFCALNLPQTGLRAILKLVAVDPIREKLAEMEKEYVIHAQTPEEELSELARQSLEGYFRSHPQTSERLAQANNLIAREHWEKQTQQKAFHIEYEVHNGTYVK